MWILEPSTTVASQMLIEDELCLHQNLQWAVLVLALLSSTGISTITISVFNFCSKKGFESRQSARARTLSTSISVTADEFHSREIEEGDDLLMVTLPASRTSELPSSARVVSSQSGAVTERSALREHGRRGLGWWTRATFAGGVDRDVFRADELYATVLNEDVREEALTRCSSCCLCCWRWRKSSIRTRRKCERAYNADLPSGGESVGEATLFTR